MLALEQLPEKARDAAGKLRFKGDTMYLGKGESVTRVGYGSYIHHAPRW